MSDLDSGLLRALSLSEQIVRAAESADLSTFGVLEAERTRLIREFRRANRFIDGGNRAVLEKIAELNDRALGQMLHHQRSKAREIDMAVVGRRAVAAYASMRR